MAANQTVNCSHSAMSGGAPALERPAPRLADRVPLTLPGLPDSLIGRSVLHLSDFHIRRTRPYFDAIVEQCARERADLVFLTGDYMTFPGDERAALRVMSEVAEALTPAIEGGIIASFGNHDYPMFRREAPRQVPGIRWIENGAVRLDELGIMVLGTSTPCDVLGAMIEARRIERECDSPPYRIMLAHEPTVLITAAQFGIEWTLAGHTHGGQLRVGPRLALHTSCDLPPRFASGILRLNESICTINRGLGSTYFDVRLFCDSHMIMYELQRGPLPGRPEERYDRLSCVRWW